MSKQGTVKALGEFLGKDFQEYEPGKVFAPFVQSKNSEYTCGNPIIIGYCKTGKLAWMEQWIEVCKCEDNGKWGYGLNTASDTCEGRSIVHGTYCFLHLPHPNYAKTYIYDSPEDAIRGCVAKVKAMLDERGDQYNKGTRKMLALVENQLSPKLPTYQQLSLF